MNGTKNRMMGYTPPMQSKATTVAAYLASLPADRRAALEQVRAVILKNLDTGPAGKSGFVEGMGYGMMGYSVPHSVFPPGYHCDPRQPLPYAGLASQKGYMSLYLMCIYGHGETESWFRKEWAKSGKKLDMGKCCIRFKKVEDLALDAIAAVIKRVTVKKYLAQYAAALASKGKDITGKKISGGAAKATGNRVPAKKSVSTKKPAPQPATTRSRPTR